MDQRWQPLTWELLLTPGGPLHQLASRACFVYESGATTDRLRVLLTNGRHSADLPHVAPGTSSRSRSPAFTVTWDHAVIPRPVP